jgi:hypothetical protein
VAFREHTPHLWTEAECVRKHLTNDVSIGSPVALAPQRSEAQRVAGVVRQVEAALERVVDPLRVGQPNVAR